MLHTHAEFFRKVAAHAATRPTYVRRDDARDVSGYQVLRAMMRQLHATGDVELSGEAAVQRVRRAVRGPTPRLSRLVVCGGGEASRVLVIDESLAVELYAKLLYMVAEYSATVTMPWFLLRAGAAVYGGAGNVHAFVNELFKANDHLRWTLRLIDQPLVADASEQARALAAQSGPSEATFLRGVDARRSGAQFVRALPTHARHDGLVRANVIVRLLCEFALARDGPASFDHAAAVQRRAVVAPSCDELGRLVAGESMMTLVEHWRVAQHDVVAHEFGTPALAESHDGNAQVQRLFERVRLASAALRGGGEPLTKHELAARFNADALRLFEALARLHVLLASSDYTTPVELALAHVRTLDGALRDDDVLVIEAIVRHCFEAPLLLRHGHALPYKNRRSARLVACVESAGVERALGAARGFDMPLQVAAIERLVHLAGDEALVTVVPRPETRAATPTAMELAASLRAVDDRLHEGRDFVVVWSPDSRETALALRRTTWRSVQLVGVAAARLVRRRGGGERSHRPAAEALARLLDAYDAGAASERDAAAALHLLAVLVDAPAVHADERRFADEHVDAALARLRGVIGVFAANALELVSVLVEAALDRAPALLRALETALTPVADDVFLSMPPNVGVEASGDWIATNTHTRALWRAFFAAPDHSSATSKYVETRNAELLAEARTVVAAAAQQEPDDVGDDDDESSERSAKRRRRSEAAAAHSFHSIVPRSAAFDADQPNVFGADAVTRSATLASVLDARGALHLHLVDAVLANSRAPRRWLASVAAVRFGEPLASKCVRVPRAPMPPTTRCCTPGAATAALLPRDLTSDEAAQLRAHAVTLGTFARLLSVAVDAVAAHPDGVARQVALLRAHALLCNAVEPAAAAEPRMAIVAAELVDDAPGKSVPEEERLLSATGLPRALCFGQRRLVAGATLNFFHGPTAP